MEDYQALAAASAQFSLAIEAPTDAAAKHFLDRFPLHVIFDALHNEVDIPGLQSSLVSCLEKILKTSYGVSLLKQSLPFLQCGLKSESALLRHLSCYAVAQLVENDAEDWNERLQLIIDHDIWSSLVACIADTDVSIATKATEAVKNIAKLPNGLALIFPSKSENLSLLKNLTESSSSLVRMRLLSLVSALFCISDAAAMVVCESGLLHLFELELNNTFDMLATLNALELLYEMTASPNASKYLLANKLLARLSDTVCSGSADPILRSRAMAIMGRLLSSDTIYKSLGELDIKTAIQAIDLSLEQMDVTNDKIEVAIDILGQIGTVKRGAELLLCNSPPTARYVVNAAFLHKGRNTQLAGTHALASIAGGERTEENLMLNEQAEASLRKLIYTAALDSSKKSPSGLFLFLLQQEPDTRIAAYRLITALVPRTWCLAEVCMKKEIIDMVTDSRTETTKTGMEFRHSCCVTIHNSLLNSPYKNDTAFLGIHEKLQMAIKRGPYLAKELIEPKPVVAVQERF